MENSIVAFGDSIMKGVVYDNHKCKYVYSEDSFVKNFERKTGFNVDNYAKFGCTLKKGENIIKRNLSKLSNYRFIALEFGGNDCDFFWPDISADPSGNHLSNTPLDIFQKMYSQIIDKLLTMQLRPVVFSLPPLDPYKYFSWISKGLDSENILKWLGDVEFIYRWQEAYNNTILKLASSKGVPLIDIREAFLKSRNYKNLLCADGIHPNEAGHSLIFDVICRYIEQLERIDTKKQFGHDSSIGGTIVKTNSKS